MSLTSLLLISSLAAGSPPDPVGVLAEFVTAVSAADTTAAMGMLAEDAFDKIDSLLANDPVFLCNLAQGFGVQLTPEQVGGMGAGDFLRTVLSAPALSGMLMFVRYAPGEPFASGDDILLPVAYSFMGMSDTMTVRMTCQDGTWLIADYYGHPPVRTGVR